MKNKRNIYYLGIISLLVIIVLVGISCNFSGEKKANTDHHEENALEAKKKAQKNPDAIHDKLKEELEKAEESSSKKLNERLKEDENQRKLVLKMLEEKPID